MKISITNFGVIYYTCSQERGLTHTNTVEGHYDAKILINIMEDIYKENSTS